MEEGTSRKSDLVGTLRRSKVFDKIDIVFFAVTQKRITVDGIEILKFIKIMVVQIYFYIMVEFASDLTYYIFIYLLNRFLIFCYIFH